MKNIVKWFNDEKGYGFIEYKDNGNISVHYSTKMKNKNNYLIQDEQIEFGLIKTDNGYKTKNVVLVK